jgi:hypothetical protein
VVLEPLQPFFVSSLEEKFCSIDEFDTIVLLQLSSSAGFNFAVYTDRAVLYPAFCFDTILNSIDQFEELSEFYRI